MDLTQSKLSRTEWNSIEVPVSQREKEILKLIDDGFNNVNIKYNSNQSLLSIIKIDKNEEIEAFLYTKYFEEKFKTFSVPRTLVRRLASGFCTMLKTPTAAAK